MPASAAPLTIETDRLLLRRPVPGDADAIFERYASDAEVTRYLAWPRHRTVDDTRAFLSFSDAEWENWPAGPYLVLDPDRRLLGSTGLQFESPYRAATGYVIAREYWGRGFATEALVAMRQLAARLGVQRLYACCHASHTASRRVLEKGGFEFEATLRRHTEFPNLKAGYADDVASYAWITGEAKPA